MNISFVACETRYKLLTLYNPGEGKIRLIIHLIYEFSIFLSQIFSQEKKKCKCLLI